MYMYKYTTLLEDKGQATGMHVYCDHVLDMIQFMLPDLGDREEPRCLWTKTKPLMAASCTSYMA